VSASIAISSLVLVAVVTASAAFALQSGSRSVPILLIANGSASNKFGAYLGEIL